MCSSKHRSWSRLWVRATNVLPMLHTGLCVIHASINYTETEPSPTQSASVSFRIWQKPLKQPQMMPHRRKTASGSRSWNVPTPRAKTYLTGPKAPLPPLPSQARVPLRSRQRVGLHCTLLPGEHSFRSGAMPAPRQISQTERSAKRASRQSEVRAAAL